MSKWMHVFLVALGISVIWECVHGPLLYVTAPFGRWFPLMLVWASLVDAAMVTLFFLAGEYFWGSFERFMAGGYTQKFYLICIGLIAAVWIEYKALYIFHQWSYNEYMPTLFSLGVSPLVQLSVTAVVTYVLIRRFIL